MVQTLAWIPYRYSLKIRRKLTYQAETIKSVIFVAYWVSGNVVRVRISSVQRDKSRVGKRVYRVDHLHYEVYVFLICLPMLARLFNQSSGIEADLHSFFPLILDLSFQGAGVGELGSEHENYRFNMLKQYRWPKKLAPLFVRYIILR